MKIANSIALTLLLGGTFQTASAAQGEMGVGTPQFGIYSGATGLNVSVVVWALANASTNFPIECSNLTLSPATMGMDTYKLAIATMLTARATGKKVRFYAHTPRDSGCGVDYVELVD